MIPQFYPILDPTENLEIYFLLISRPEKKSEKSIFRFLRKSLVYVKISDFDAIVPQLGDPGQAPTPSEVAV